MAGPGQDAPNSTLVIFTHRYPIDFGISTKRTRKGAIGRVQSTLEALVGGAKHGDGVVIQPNAAGAMAPAAAVWAGSGLSGTVGVTLNGVAITVATGASDQATSDALLAAVQASSNALVQNLLTAGVGKKATVACASVAAGDSFKFKGIKFTGQSSATGKLGEFDASGNNSADATALALAINAHPALNQQFMAIASSANVFIYPLKASTAANDLLTDPSSTFTLTQFTADPSFAVYALQPGAVGNQATIAASGTGASILGSATRLSGGVGGNVTRILDQFGGGAL